MKKVNDRIIIRDGIFKAYKELTISKKNNKKIITAFNSSRFFVSDYDKKRKYVSDYLNWDVAPYLWDKMGREDLLPDLRDSEKLLYTTDKFYRDHLLHTFRVWGLGLYLYYKGINKYIPTPETFHLTWFMSSVYHDVGYPIKGLKSLQEALKAFKCYGLEVGDLFDKIAKLLKSRNISDKLKRMKPEIKDIKKPLADQPHGIISARLLLKGILNRNVYIKNKAAVESALEAIIDHDSKGGIIDFRRKPYSALLIICDELQEWARPYISSLLGEKEYFLSAKHIMLNVETRGPKIEALVDYSPRIGDLRSLLGWKEDRVTKEKHNNLKRLRGIDVEILLKYSQRKTACVKNYIRSRNKA